MLERRDYEAIVKIQKAFRNWKAKRHAVEQRAWAADLLKGKKERRRASLDVKFAGTLFFLLFNPYLFWIIILGDYLGVENNHGLLGVMQEYSMLLLLDHSSIIL